VTGCLCVRTHGVVRRVRDMGAPLRTRPGWMPTARIAAVGRNGAWTRAMKRRRPCRMGLRPACLERRRRVDDRAPPGPHNEVIPTTGGLIFRKGAGLPPRASVSLNLVTSRCRNDRVGVDHGRRADPASVSFGCFLALSPCVSSKHLPVFVTRSEAPLGRAPAGHWRSRRTPPSAPSPRGLDTDSVAGRAGASGR
jgi:hypothetical protein